MWFIPTLKVENNIITVLIQPASELYLSIKKIILRLRCAWLQEKSTVFLKHLRPAVWDTHKSSQVSTRSPLQRQKKWISVKLFYFSSHTRTHINNKYNKKMLRQVWMCKLYRLPNLHFDLRTHLLPMCSNFIFKTTNVFHFYTIRGRLMFVSHWPMHWLTIETFPSTIGDYLWAREFRRFIEIPLFRFLSK